MRGKLVPGIILTMIILCLVPVTTSAAEFQPLTLNLDSSGSQLINVSNMSASRTSAEFLVQSLAESAKTGRIIGGWVLMGTGVLFLGANFNDEFSNIFPWIGGGLAVIGGITLTSPSLPEKYYLEIQSISDPDKRETAAASFLLSLSSQSKTSRLIDGIASAGLAVYYFNTPSDNDHDWAITLAAEAIYSFLVKSPAETAWEGYDANQDSGRNVRTAFELGVNPKNGGLRLGYMFAL